MPERIATERIAAEVGTIVIAREVETAVQAAKVGPQLVMF